MSSAHGVTADQLLAVADPDAADCFDPAQRVAMRYADAMTQSRVEVDDALFAELQAHFDPPQIVELTAAIAWENYRARFNHALSMEAEGFAEGAVCAIGPRPELPARSS